MHLACRRAVANPVIILPDESYWTDCRRVWSRVPSYKRSTRLVMAENLRSASHSDHRLVYWGKHSIPQFGPYNFPRGVLPGRLRAATEPNESGGSDADDEDAKICGVAFDRVLAGWSRARRRQRRQRTGARQGFRTGDERHIEYSR